MISLKNTLKAISSKISALNTLLNDVPHYTLLWTNPNPTSSFSAQTISLNLSKYDAVEIVFKKDSTESYYKSIRTPYILNQRGAIDITQRAFSSSREFQMTSTGLAFSTGYALYTYGNPTSSDARCVPYKIYGIKFGGGYNLKALLFARKEVFV